MLYICYVTLCYMLRYTMLRYVLLSLSQLMDITDLNIVSLFLCY